MRHGAYDGTRRDCHISVTDSLRRARNQDVPLASNFLAEPNVRVVIDPLLSEEAAPLPPGVGRDGPCQTM